MEPFLLKLLLTHLEPGGFRFAFHNSPVDCTRELFKLSKDFASLLVCNEKLWVLGFIFLWVTL